MSSSKKELPPCGWEAIHERFPRTDALTDVQVSGSHPGRVSCEYCAGHSKTPWFLAKNLPQHLKCASHLKSVGEEQARRKTKEHLDRLRAQDLERFQKSEHQYAQLSCSGQPEVQVPTKPPPGIGEQQMWEDFELDRSDVSLLDTDRGDQFNPMEQHEAKFYRALDRAGMNSDPTGWDFEEFATECDVDETLTKVMQDLGQLRKGFVSQFDRAHGTIRSWQLTRRG